MLRSDQTGSWTRQRSLKDGNCPRTKKGSPHHPPSPLHLLCDSLRRNWVWAWGEGTWLSPHSGPEPWSWPVQGGQRARVSRAGSGSLFCFSLLDDLEQVTQPLTPHLLPSRETISPPAPTP